LLPPDLRDWLDEDHLAWLLIEAVEGLDLEPFHAAGARPPPARNGA
jgi:hypothetical protein